MLLTLILLLAQELPAKGRPWTAKDIIEALKSGANEGAILKALEKDKVQVWREEMGRLRKAGMKTAGPLDQYLLINGYIGAKPWASDQGKAAAEKRRSAITPIPFPQDSPELRAKAAAGDATAQYDLAFVEEKLAKHGEARDLRNLAAKAGYPRAQHVTADALESAGNADKTKADAPKVAELHRISAEAGDVDGAYKLAMSFRFGKGVAQNLLEAERWLVEAVARGEGYPTAVLALNELAKIYAFLDLFGEEEAKARWARELIRRGGPFEENMREKLEERDHARVAQRIDALPPEAPLLDSAERARLEAADDAASLLKLGEALAGGHGLPQNDHRAVACFQKAAEKGEPAAMRRLADAYRQGHGVKKDPALRLTWIERAGAAGDVAALRELGDLWWRGPDTPRDIHKAVAAFEKAGEKGDALSLFHLGNIFFYGRMLLRDEARAADFYRRAAAAGHAEAKESLDRLLKARGGAEPVKYPRVQVAKQTKVEFAVNSPTRGAINMARVFTQDFEYAVTRTENNAAADIEVFYAKSREQAGPQEAAWPTHDKGFSIKSVDKKPVFAALGLGTVEPPQQQALMRDFSWLTAPDAVSAVFAPAARKPGDDVFKFYRIDEKTFPLRDRAHALVGYLVGDYIPVKDVTSVVSTFKGDEKVGEKDVAAFDLQMVLDHQIDPFTLKTLVLKGRVAVWADGSLAAADLKGTIEGKGQDAQMGAWTGTCTVTRTTTRTLR